MEIMLILCINKKLGVDSTLLEMHNILDKKGEWKDSSYYYNLQ